MADNRIGVGIIGANVHYGWGTTAHVPALQALPEFELRAVCTAHRETAQEAAAHYGVPLAFDDPAAMVRHPDIDLVAVSVRAPDHHALVMAALEAGKHVYCEWPLGVDVREAVEMRDLAQAKRVRHMVGLQARGAPALNYMRDLIAEGYVGEVLACSMVASLPGAGQRAGRYAWAHDRTKGVSTLTIAGGHSIDALCFCLGEFRSVSAVVTTRVKRAAIEGKGETVDVTSPDNVLVSGELESGAVASIHIKNVPAHATGLLFEVHGTDGALVLLSERSVQVQELSLRGARKDDEATGPLEVPERYRWVPDGTPAGAPYNVAQLYRRMAEGIRTAAPVSPDFDLAVRRHQLLEAIERASDTGQRQTLA